MFSDITLSSAEDTNILTQYITASAQDVESVLKQFITASTYSSSAVSMTITNTRGDSDFETRTQALAESYVTLNSVGEYLSMVHPDIAQKYQRDAQGMMNTIINKDVSLDHLFITCNDHLIPGKKREVHKQQIFHFLSNRFIRRSSNNINKIIVL